MRVRLSSRVSARMRVRLSSRVSACEGEGENEFEGECEDEGEIEFEIACMFQLQLLHCPLSMQLPSSVVSAATSDLTYRLDRPGTFL